VLLIIVGALLASLAMRSPFRVDVVRDRASLARLVDDGQIENVYRLQVMNATEDEQTYRVKVAGLPGAVIDGATELRVASTEARWLTVAVRVPPAAAEAAGAGAHPISFDIERIAEPAKAQAPVVLTEKSTFIVPR
jgi:polyferredoxin